MKCKLSDSIHKSNRAHYQNFLKQWPWEWLVTLRVPSGDHDKAMRIIHNTLLRKQGGQVASMGVYVNGKGYNGRHIHALLLGRFNGGRTLKDVLPAPYCCYYGAISKTGGKGAVIEPITDLCGAVAYVLNPCNTPSGKHELLRPWGRILKNTKISLSEAA